MPLVQSVLKSALQSVFESRPSSAADAASQLAQAYATYAQAGVFGSSTIPSLASLQAGLQSQLQSGFSSQSAASVAAAFAAGLTAGWIGVPVVGGQAGATVTCPGAAAITAPLTAVFMSMPGSASDAADQIATILHVATQTVTAAVAPPPGTILPIA
jgi:hypothetical protein